MTIKQNKNLFKTEISPLFRQRSLNEPKTFLWWFEFSLTRSYSEIKFVRQWSLSVDEKQPKPDFNILIL